MTDRRRIRGATAFALAGLVLAASGCGGAFRSYDPVPAPRGGAYAAFRVGAPDVLTVVILPDPPILREVVVRQLRDLGFLYVTVDLQGFRSGSLNEALPTVPATTLPSGDRRAS